MRFVLASDNANKLREYRELLSGSGVELLSKSEAGCALDVDETGATFAENARLKALAVCAGTGLAAIADDSGLCVDALDGAPGLYSARYTGDHAAGDAERCALLLRNMQGVKDRSARFVCAICCALPGGGEVTAEGECAGEILEAARGENGFGYDPVFRPAGGTRSMAELSAAEKNRISHRGKALRAFRKEWERYCHDQQ